MHLGSLTIGFAVFTAGCTIDAPTSVVLDSAESARLAAVDELHRYGLDDLDRVIWTTSPLDHGWEILAHNTRGLYQPSPTIGGPPRFTADTHRFIFDSSGHVIHHQVGDWDFVRPNQALQRTGSARGFTPLPRLQPVVSLAGR